MKILPCTVPLSSVARKTGRTIKWVETAAARLRIDIESNRVTVVGAQNLIIEDRRMRDNEIGMESEHPTIDEIEEQKEAMRRNRKAALSPVTVYLRDKAEHDTVETMVVECPKWNGKFLSVQRFKGK